ncbi:LOW QUALITY PROTEIN: exostosin-2-like [Limulus polyphemus]|uniref:LOW QUALITY PROTEIN: exostosin-2-like n=1 Tax=Limulus polyphemus TaxID=6850 RepID=A0ABM1S2C4_LIMPO|nr:LOW QUALITY PROTEIN: exostosin-2-like [Limulus polyphemus]
MVSVRNAPRLTRRYTPFFNVLFCFILVALVLGGLSTLWPWNSETPKREFVLQSEEFAPVATVLSTDALAKSTKSSCTFYNCFDVYRCGQHGSSLTVYIYPILRYVDENGLPVMNALSKEFMEILEAIQESKFYVTNPDKACILVPALDLLNQNNLHLKETSQILAGLPYWNSGINHLLFNMLPGNVPNYNPCLEVERDNAIVAGAGLSTWTYRRTYDISIPLFSPLSQDFQHETIEINESPRKWLIVSPQINIHSEYREELEELKEEHPELLVLDECIPAKPDNATERCHDGETYFYPSILKNSTFCLVLQGARLAQATLSDAMMYGCIPVVAIDGYVLPFSEVLDWKRVAVRLREDHLHDLIHILKSISEHRILEMRKQAHFIWTQYFSSIQKITLTTLQIINDRVFPHFARTYEEWNDPPWKEGTTPPLNLPVIVPKSQGFTAVILTYDRVESLFKVIRRVVQAPSIAKVLVVWNNQQKHPPPATSWPKINKPLKVVQTKENKLSNRFYPYDEIETEAVLAIDDDIVMLTADELEFAYEVWREFPDRIVGFPSRVHLWDNNTGKWKYESEWTNEISMVLTGAAFYHKYYSYLYTTSLPGDIKTWVDSRMNCEDIAMNFLVANITGKAPIKVTPRKKFKCPECTNVEMLSADVIHMAERSECINKFAQVYGKMPLKTVEFRADPVLYKDNFPEKLKRFNNIGSL